MNNSSETIRQQPRDVKVASKADVVVVGGGPAGVSAALAAARNGAKVTLLERYNHLGGLALVLVPLWLVLVALDRLYLGVHYPTDVLAGWCLSLAWVTGVWLLTNRQSRKRGN